MPNRRDHPNLPLLDPKALPQEEQAECEHLIGNLKALDHFRARYACAMFLLCECNEASEGRASVLRPMVRKFTSGEIMIADDEMKREWRQIAFRDAAHTIFHFGIILDGIVKGAKRCPTLLRSVDVSLLRQAQPMFEKYFPKSSRMRNAVAHAGDVLHSPASMARNNLYYPGEIHVGGLILTGVISSPVGYMTDSFRMYLTFKGDVISVELSSAKHQQMISIVDAVYAAFRNHQPTSP